tara:strand:- start:425 stop:853 length:429 start_codon:yes stop_codon:yes gene_type:complete
MITSPTVDDFVVAVESLIGTRIVHRGRSRNGIDCVGVPIVALRSLGLDAEEPKSYGVIPDADLLTGYLRKCCRLVAFEDRRAGDLLQVRVGNQGRHLAVITGVESDTQSVVVAVVAKRKKVIRTVRDLSQTVAVWRLNQWQL